MRRKIQVQARFQTLEALLIGGAEVRAFDYARASQDKSGFEKSITGQHEENGLNISRHSWTWAGSLDDNNQSGEDETREGLNKLYAAIMAHELDVLVLWASNREARDLLIFATLRNLCRDNGVYFWLVGGKIFDLRDKNDNLSLGLQAVLAETHLLSLKEATRRGIRTAALDGDPAGGIQAFGYRRIYDSRSGKMIGQEPDLDTPEWAPEGATWCAAKLVTWMFETFAVTGNVYALVVELNRLGVPNPRTYNARQKGFQPLHRTDSKKGRWKKGDPYRSEWEVPPVRNILRNRVYLADRLHDREVIAQGSWEPLVKPEIFDAVQKKLSDPKRKTTRVQQVKHFQSGIAQCGGTLPFDDGTDHTCGLSVSVKRDHCRKGKPLVYRCKRGHSTVLVEEMDHFVENALMLWYAEVYPSLNTASRGNEDALAEAENELQELEEELEAWFNDPDITHSKYKAKQAQYAPRIADAKRRIREAIGLPSVLDELGGPDTEARWSSWSLSARRNLLRAWADITIIPVGKGNRVPLRDRVRVTPRFGQP